MKTKRQAKMLELIKRNDIETQEELAAAAILKQYIMDNGISELAQAFDGNTVDAAKLVHLIEKAKPHALAAIWQSSLNTEVETRLERQSNQSRKAGRWGTSIPSSWHFWRTS